MRAKTLRFPDLKLVPKTDESRRVRDLGVRLARVARRGRVLGRGRSGGGSAAHLDISAGNSDEVLAPYPAGSDALSAGEWNRAAVTNNRVEVHWQPTH